ncbi:RagB/SusD family nutrient uptake outer membrane protein [uncultured Bacteroides sp.]|uniref:RagB/SusD family nutrient uptake outer membrane protein n=1 Tax=uncultured Bacteroides sp. TaxID=162156 RepID=UPI002AAAD3D0|nr:RagB/SusD family nutrient uptake outer membrane protein [uncultured Bacteroides sp.]
MKTTIFKILSLVFTMIILYSCSLDEYNPTEVTGNETLATFNGWKGMQSYCYSPLYDEMFSASDYLSVSEAGTDIWLTAKNATNTQQLFYYEGLTTSTNATNKLFKQAYAIINTCNAIINHASSLSDGNSNDIEVLTAETHCLRAFYYLVLVTNYGNVTLTLDDSNSNAELAPKRNSIEEIYSQIITDLTYASKHLGTTPYGDNYARVTKKTALGLLARAYAQGAGEGLSENGVSYWQRAKEVAEDMIENMGTYGAYMYNDVADVWAHANNRNNKEALFIASGPQAGESDAFNSGSLSNKLFTYMMADPNKLSEVYKTANKRNYYYGRVNNNLYAPSKYLVDCFSEYDKRWENSFVTAFSDFSMAQVNWVPYRKKTLTLTTDICNKYGINTDFVGKKIYPYADINAISHTYGGNQYVASIWPKGDHTGNTANLITPKNAYVHPYPLDEDEDRFAIYLSKKSLTATEKAKRAYICINIDDLYDSEGKYHEASFDGTNSYQLFPSLSKFDWSYEGLNYGSNLQVKTGDMFIMRMAEVYLIAAEANVALGDGERAAQYINVLRKRACRNEANYEEHMKVTTVSEEDIFDEYARELCGEFSRWALLKRHKAFESRLAKYNVRAAQSFDSSKNYLRPISYDFLSQINNADEYGTNGY